VTRGRGQPPKITPGQYPRLLELLRAGLAVGAVAAELEVTRQTLYNLPKRVDEETAELIRQAREEGRRQRQKHGTETCYVERDCRRPECVQAATAARADRRRRAGEGAGPSVYELADTAGPFPDRPTGLADTA
jgi:hypothetical protein